MALRDYQAQDIAELRPLVADHRSVLHQLPTGAGKTAEISEIVSLIRALNPHFVVWFVCPRNELLQQASEHFEKWNISHSHIKAGREESIAFKVQIVSKDTLLRRLHRIKNWPDVLIFDEAHLYYDAQLKIIEWARQARPALKVIGITATPERLDGRGLSTKAGGSYEAIHFGCSIPWLTDRGFLAPLRYFAPPIIGLQSIHRRGTEYDANELETLLEKRKVYGDVVRYYQKYGSINHTSISSIAGITRIKSNYHKGRPALIFCRSVKSAYETAHRFSEAGYLFFCIEGDMKKGERRRLIDALRKGEIDGLTNCDLATYGLDIPRVEYGASIRPTLSRALYFQMVGRILRPFNNKEEALFFDHANLVEEHSDASSPGIPLFYLPELTWNFNGRERRERAPADASAVRLCPLKDYQYCADPACARVCRLDPDAASKRAALEVVDVALQERTPARGWSELAPGEKRDVQDRIGSATDAWLAALAEDPPRIDPGPVGELLRIADELGRSKLWVYWYLSEKENKRAVNVPLLHEIARQSGFKPGWVFFQTKRIREGLKEKTELIV